MRRQHLFNFVKMQFDNIANVEIEESSKLLELDVNGIDILEISMEIEMEFDCELNDDAVADIFKNGTVKEFLDYIEKEI